MTGILRSALLTLWLVLTSGGAIFVLRAQVIETESGPVEFIGLRHWTPERVQDALAAVDPELSLHSAACAAVLRSEIGFPSAMVASFSGFPGVPEGYTAIVLVEPEEGHRVRYAASPPDSLGPVDGWEAAYDLFPEKRWAWQMAIRGSDGDGRSLPDSTSLPAVRRFLRAHGTEEDKVDALRVLETDRNWINRSIAAALLSNFPADDRVRWALIRAARGIGPHDYSTGEALVALQAFPWDEAALEWSPVAEDLRAIVDGTSLFAFMPVLQILVRSGVSPALADDLLEGGGELVLAHLGSSHPHHRGVMRAFLTRMSGEDFGEDVDRWGEWIQSLGSTEEET